MSTRVSSESAHDVRAGIGRVAIRATLGALVIYVAACTIADLVAAHRLESAVTERLATKLATVVPAIPRSGPIRPIGAYSPDNTGDLDDAPVVAWFVPLHARAAVALDTNAPKLPTSDLAVSGTVDTTIGGRPFRLQGQRVARGNVIVGTSTVSQESALSTVIAVEAALAPIALITLFAAAWLIGRRASAPLERSRLRQLEFTADASHELRTPLGVIEAEAGLALSAPRTSAGYREAIERIAGETERLRSIVEDLLWLSRFDSLPQPPGHDVVDLTSVASVCADRFAPVAVRKRISLTTSSEAEPVLVFAPADWLDRLASVLVDNALRYAGPGGEVAISATAAAGKAALRVDDSGPGIPDDQRAFIFQRFHRASTVPGGAGLGLAIADAIAKGSGGSWTVTTSPFGGARFMVTWPAARLEHSLGVLRGHARRSET